MKENANVVIKHLSKIPETNDTVVTIIDNMDILKKEEKLTELVQLNIEKIILKK